MSRSEVDEYTGRTREVPETITERIAWALAARDSQSREGYLQDDELEGLEILLQAVERRCGSDRAEADFLGVPIASLKRYVDRVRRLAKDERRRRDRPNDPLLVMHLAAAYWQDYMPEAEAAFSIAIEDHRVAALAQAHDLP